MGQIEVKRQYGVIAIDYPSLFQSKNPIVCRQQSEVTDGKALNLIESDLWMKKIRRVALQSDKIVGIIIHTDYPVKTQVTNKFSRLDHQRAVATIARQGIWWSETLMRDVEFALANTTLH